MSDLRAEFRKAGFDTFVKGDVHIVNNTDVLWTKDPKRGETHRVILVGNTKLLQDPSFPIVRQVPCTTTPFYPNDLGLEVEIPGGEDGFTKENIFAITYLEGPIRKSSLGRRVGTVSAEALLLIEAGIVRLHELAGDEVEDDEEGDDGER